MLNHTEKCRDRMEAAIAADPTQKARVERTVTRVCDRTMQAAEHRARVEAEAAAEAAEPKVEAEEQNQQH